MKIHEIIQQRRKSLGLTQEQVAEYLGVTPPAVHKWEKGSTCPDIALLPPLARLLKIDLNTLFGFYEDLTQQEITLFCKEIHETVLSQGFDAGFAAAQEKLREYPNSDVLLHNLALQLQGLLATASLEEAQAEAYLRKIDAWYERLTQSEEAVIRNGANFMLASRAITDKQYDKAQAYLDQMPDRKETPDKDMLQAAIYWNQDRAQEAAELLDRMLFSAINDVQMILYRLIDANAALGDQEAADYIAERAVKFAEIFDLSRYTTILPEFLVADKNKDVRQTVALLREMLQAMSSVWNPKVSPLYRRISTISGSASMKQMIGPLLQNLKQAPEYAYLQEDEEFRALLAEYEAPLDRGAGTRSVTEG